LFLARRLKSLQSIPVTTKHGVTIYVDLRLLSTHGVFLRWGDSPEDEDVISSVVQAGDVVYDIGAHIGLYTVMFSRLVGSNGKVISFELNPEILPTLQKTIDSLGNATLYGCGLSDKTESTVMYVPEEPSGGSLNNWTDGELGSVHTVKCEVKRLDDLVQSEDLPAPDFIKIDVEGAEELVFRGAENILNTEKAPIIFFEISKKACEKFGISTTSTMDFLSRFEKSEYTFFDGRGQGNEIVRIAEVPEPISGALAVNLLAVPKARLDRLGIRSNVAKST